MVRWVEYLQKGGSPQQQTQTQEIDPMLKPYITKGLDEGI